MNLTSSSILAPMLNLFPRKGNNGNKLDIITWNVYVGHNRAGVANALRGMAKDYNPHVFALQEATNQQPLHLAGYRTFHLPKDKPKGLYGEDADTALLIRNDIIIDGHRVAKMRKQWKGPDHGYIHEPRRYQCAWIQTSAVGPIWKLSAGHWPFGEAQQETIQWVHDWFARTMPGRPTVHVGDLNAMPQDFKMITNLPDVKVVGHRIDQAITRNVKVATAKAIGAHGSDHEAVLIHLEA